MLKNERNVRPGVINANMSFDGGRCYAPEIWSCIADYRDGTSALNRYIMRYNSVNRLARLKILEFEK